jgi:signal transduction histidine kinase/DNA-binding NarL/FixJ family response regulator
MLKSFAGKILGIQQNRMKKIESVLKKLEDDLFMNAPYGYLAISSEGIIKKVNHLILNWTGYEPSEILNQPIDQFAIEELAETRSEAIQVYSGIFRLRLKNGNAARVFLDVVKLKESDNNTVLRMTLKDSVENKISDAENYESGHLQTHKMNYSSSSVTHEIQTPLSIIKGTLDLLDDTALTSQQKEYLEILKNSSEVLRNVMSDVIDFNSLNEKAELKNDAINIRDFVNGIFKMHSVIALKKNLDLKLIVDEEIPETVYGDKTKIAQVLLNLLANAVKFTEQGAVILEMQQKHISNKDVTLLFTVTDTGIGIEKGEINLIFDEFTQANASVQKKYGGLGLGLSICKKILALYGSTIKVKSSSLGSKFSFLLTLPIGPSANAHSKDLEKDKFKNTVTILIADDNETNALITSHYLKKLGIQYEIASNGDIAYHKVLERKFDLILMDIQMPVSSGINATRKIRAIEDEQIKNIPIVAFSADNIFTKKQLSEIGIDDFLLKPFNVEELIKAITSNLPKAKIADYKTSEFSPLINLESLYKLTAGNPDELKILIQRSIEEFEEAKIGFINAFHDRDVNKIKAVAHKLKSQIHYLKAFELQEIIKEGLETLQNQEFSRASDNILKEIVAALDSTISAMRTLKV